jgi:hypothetical protein
MKAICVLLAIVALALPTRAAEGASAQPLTVSAYCLLSVDRLDLARRSWYWQQSPPTAAQLGALWDKYRTSEKAFLTFGSVHAQEVKDYLEAHPELNARIEELSEEIRVYVRQMRRDSAPNDHAGATAP